MKRKIMLGLFALAAVLTTFFVIRAVMFAGIWLDPNRGMHPIEPWMTPRYIGRSYDIPPAVMQEILSLTPGETPRKPLEALAETHGVPVQLWIDELEAIIAARPPK